MSGKLTLYTRRPDNPTIEPAPRDRDWMDATADRFAYRCLPLAMANAHGWLIRNTSRIRAIWNGGSRVDDVLVERDDQDVWAAKSHFGQGTITWPTGGVFRTPPGVSLWVSGPPNLTKHGVQPLSGVVETDWSPYSFTMNWRFTAPDIPVVFEAGEPYCFIMPIMTELAESLEPEIRDMRDDPDLSAQYESWSVSRRRWTVEKKTPGTRAHEERWQKLYFRGQYPDEGGGPPNHRTKVKAKAFLDRRKTS